jgi:hypothetical protein
MSRSTFIFQNRYQYGEESINMDFGLAFTFPFQDQDWIKKVLIGAALLLVPIFGLIVVLGWSVEVSRRVIRRDTEVLPGWDNFGEKFSLGLKAFVVLFVLSLPLTLFSLPYTFINPAASDTMSTVFTIFSICFSCFSILYSIVLALGYPAALGILADTDSIGSALNPGKIFSLVRSAPAAYLITLLGIIVAGFVAGLGVIICAIGVLATIAYAMLIEGHLFGQAYLEAETASV